MAGELDEHLAGKAYVPVAMGGEPANVVWPDDDDAAAWPADPLHLRQAGLAAMTWSGRERRACDDQVGAVVGDGQVVEEAVGHSHAMPMIGLQELSTQEMAQRRRGFNRNDLPRTVDELERQPTRARADLDDPLEVVRQPPKHAGVKPLRAGEPVIELRFEPVQQFPGQGDVGLRIAAPSRNKAFRLVRG